MLPANLKTLNFQGMEYLVIYEEAEDGTIWAQVPDLSGCYSCGGTLQETRANIVMAIELFLGAAREAGINIPKPHHIKAELIKLP
jgi:predicted RNase H-like HicB family nuclease